MIYISPPFGNYISISDCTSVAGTFTYFRRKGLIRQVLKTLRPVEGGWRNGIGLRNKGIINIKEFNPDKVYSICALKYTPNRYDLPPHMQRYLWDSLMHYIPSHIPIELNIGCPNVMDMADISDFQLESYIKKFDNLTVKLPPTSLPSYIENLYHIGIRKFHLSNTFPVQVYTDNGIICYGLSGRPLREKNLPFVEKIADMKLNGISIIAGGGIYTPQDVRDYHKAGATDYSLSTIFFTPWRVSSVLQEIRKISNVE